MFPHMHSSGQSLQVLDGAVGELESKAGSLTATELYKEVLPFSGMGPFTAANVLQLLGMSSSAVRVRLLLSLQAIGLYWHDVHNTIVARPAAIHALQGDHTSEGVHKDDCTSHSVAAYSAACIEKGGVRPKHLVSHESVCSQPEPPHYLELTALQATLSALLLTRRRCATSSSFTGLPG